jgi:hypothetical protein
MKVKVSCQRTNLCWFYAACEVIELIPLGNEKFTLFVNYQGDERTFLWSLGAECDSYEIVKE